ncbi:uncharacterized protein si:dkey-262k9.2 [Pseudorasbora parva]|uniref:uncharacterized protein si:dkey-262k9.2 n=1 Tax=Pseudorasbora parva TaxID=51549 RepID=UPI00351E4D17
MLRLLFLFLIIQGSAVKSEDTEGTSSGSFGDDEDADDEYSSDVINPYNGVQVKSEVPEADPGLDKSTGGEEAGGTTLVIVIAAVSVTVLAIASIVATVFFRRYLQRREQGVYSVPAEQGQKAAV